MVNEVDKLAGRASSRVIYLFIIKQFIGIRNNSESNNNFIFFINLFFYRFILIIVMYTFHFQIIHMVLKVFHIA